MQNLNIASEATPARILVIDDEPDLELLVRHHFRKQIRKKEYEFIFASNGAEALEKVQAHPDIHVVLSDINMPIMDGFMLLSKIAEIDRVIKVVMISAYGDLPNIRAAMNRGAFDFLTKPIDFADFQRTMEKTLQQAVRMEEWRRQHERLEAIRQFFSPGLAEQLERDPTLLEGRTQEVTVLSSDLRGFSQLAERLGPQETCQFVRDMMERLSNRIIEHGGLIVDYAGDGILAMWNAPVAQAEHAERACRAAVSMLAEMPGLEADWRDVVRSTLTLGIGINTGTALVGNTGSRRKVKYGPHGHIVNLASRLQSLCKNFGTPLIVSAATRSALPEELVSRRLGTVRVHGIDTPVVVYELVAPGREAPAWIQYRERYERAVQQYEAGQFQDSEQTLAPLLETLGNTSKGSDVALKMLIERVREQLSNPAAPFDSLLYRAP